MVLEIYCGQMPHQFTRHDEEPEPQAAGRGGRIPPSRYTAAAVLDPEPFRPKKPLQYIPAIPVKRLVRVGAILVLVALAAFALVVLFKSF